MGGKVLPIYLRKIITFRRLSLGRVVYQGEFQTHGMSEKYEAYSIMQVPINYRHENTIRKYLMKSRIHEYIEKVRNDFTIDDYIKYLNERIFSTFLI